MVLSADDLGIRKGLNPIFCQNCGNRIGWVNEETEESTNELFCEDCAKLNEEDLREM